MRLPAYQRSQSFWLLWCSVAFCHLDLCTRIHKYLSIRIHSVTTQKIIIFSLLFVTFLIYPIFFQSHDKEYFLKYWYSFSAIKQHTGTIIVLSLEVCFRFKNTQQFDSVLWQIGKSQVHLILSYLFKTTLSKEINN
jgi:hypothetical protein